MGCQITWFGHSAFRFVSLDGTVILVDPWIADNPMCPVGLEAIQEVHAICLTHDHPHHVGEAVELAQTFQATIVAPSPITKSLLASDQVPRDLIVHNGSGMNLGGTCRVNKIKITMVEAAHLTTSGASAGYVITMEDSQRIYHAGDTGLFYGMKLLTKLFNPALACLPVGGVFTMDAKQATLAVQLMRLRRVWPMHYASLPELAQDVDELRLMMTKHCPTTELIVQAPGEPYEMV